MAMSGARDHGGDIDTAIRRFGGEGWIDLSTGINRQPYPVPDLPAEVWRALPTSAATRALADVAAAAFATRAKVLPLAGAQQAIQLLPHIWPRGLARVLSPTYNEHAAALRMAGWRVEETDARAALAGVDLAVVVNPNNPDGARHDPGDLLHLAGKVQHLVVDESFGDVDPGLSLAPHAGQRGLVVLRSFGKFHGLAGLRLGFAIGHEEELAAVAGLAGPWPVSGAALEIGARALADIRWAEDTRQRLRREMPRLDVLCAPAGWRAIGGTALFRLYETPDAGRAQEHLARARIWSRIFPYSSRWLRLGLPGGEAEWQRLADALEQRA